MSQTSSEQQSPGQVQGRQQSHPPSKRKGYWRTPAIVAALVSAVVVIAASIISLVWLRPIPTPVLASTISLMLAPLPSPSVTITYPRDGDQVSTSAMVQGTASDIPQDEELWLFIVPDGVTAYFPQPGPIKVFSGGKWSEYAFIGSASDPRGTGYTLILALVGKSDTTAQEAIRVYFLQFLQQPIPNPIYGIDPMKLTGVQWMTQIRVVRR